MSELELTYEVEDRVGVVTFDRPPVNAVRYRDMEALCDLLSDLPRGDELAVVYATGGEKTFMAGHDVNEFLEYDPDEEPENTAAYMSTLERAYRFPLPLIVAVDGPAVGAGAILASCADVRVASPDASFAITEINVGIIGGVGPLRRLLPDGIVRYMGFTGSSIGAERAHQLGMVAVLSDDPVGTAIEIAADVASKNPHAVRAAKRAMLDSQPDWPLEDYRREREYIAELREHQNVEEAARAFLEDREPEFEGD